MEDPRTKAKHGRGEGRRSDMRQFFAQPGTCPKLPACPELPASFDIDHPGHANFLLSPEPGPELSAPRTSYLARNFRPPEASFAATVPTFGLGRTLPGTSGARNFRPGLELLALPACSHLGRGPCTLSPLRLYILIHPVCFRVSIG